MDVPIVATLEVIYLWNDDDVTDMTDHEVIPPKPGSNRLSRKDKQGGWSVPNKTRHALSMANSNAQIMIASNHFEFLLTGARAGLRWRWSGSCTT